MAELTCVVTEYGHSGWTPRVSNATDLEDIRCKMLEGSSQRKSGDSRRNIIEELSQHILHDCLTTIDWYLAGCYPWPVVPDLCENIFGLAHEYDFSAMTRYMFPGSRPWGCYQGILRRGKECYAFNLGDMSQEWWFGDERGRNKVVANILVTCCLNRRARMLLDQ